MAGPAPATARKDAEAPDRRGLRTAEERPSCRIAARARQPGLKAPVPRNGGWVARLRSLRQLPGSGVKWRCACPRFDPGKPVGDPPHLARQGANLCLQCQNANGNLAWSPAAGKFRLSARRRNAALRRGRRTIAGKGLQRADYGLQIGYAFFKPANPLIQRAARWRRRWRRLLLRQRRHGKNNPPARQQDGGGQGKDGWK